MSKFEFEEFIIMDQIKLHGATIQETLDTLMEFCPELTESKAQQLILDFLKEEKIVNNT
jgi:hypothetical protein